MSSDQLDKGVIERLKRHEGIEGSVCLQASVSAYSFFIWQAD